MTRKLICAGAGLALFALALSPAQAASLAADCDARPPEAEVPGSATTNQAPNEATDKSLTRKLATCGSVLDPPPVGDRDIIEPAPRVGDDINIHPDAPPARQ